MSQIPAGPISATRIGLFAPVASFRDPMFPGVTRCLPVPPPSTARGMLAAGVGQPGYAPMLGMAAHAEGAGTDLETYHPIAVDGKNPAIGGRVPARKGGMTIRERTFLVNLHVTLWVPDEDGRQVACALRRPVWALRLGRSQDLVHVTDIRQVTLEPVSEANVGWALAPTGAHKAAAAATLRLASIVSLDRLSTRYHSYLWCPDGGGHRPVISAYHDQGQAVWLLSP